MIFTFYISKIRRSIKKRTIMLVTESSKMKLKRKICEVSVVYLTDSVSSKSLNFDIVLDIFNPDKSINEIIVIIAL